MTFDEKANAISFLFPKIFLKIECPFILSQFKQEKGGFNMPRLSKKAKREWNFFISPKTGRRTYNDLWRKCSNACKQSFKAVIVFCPKYQSKRSVKNAPNSDKFTDSS